MEASDDKSRAAFDLEEYYGEYLDAETPFALSAQVARLTDPGWARETLHWGRNYLYTTDWDGPDGRVEVVVKQFRNQGLRARLRRLRRGSRAKKNWTTALRLAAAGIGTPQPLMWIESKRVDGPSFYVSRRVTDHAEIRHVFRALQANECGRLFPDLDPGKLFSALGAFLRRLHEAGILHRDVSIGNVLTRHNPDGSHGFQLVDLNRARVGGSLGVWKRSRDLSRLPILRPDLRRLFLNAYWGSTVADLGLRSLLFRIDARGYLAKHWFKNHVRDPIRSLVGSLTPRQPHVHIPGAPDGASSRDKIVWDRLSDQPHQHAGTIEKSRLRFADLGRHAQAARYALSRAPRIWSRVRELRRELYREPIDWRGVGVAMRPWPGDPSASVELLDELEADHVLIRLHPWQERHDEELALARELHAKGYDLAFSLPQNRDLVRDLSAWRAAIETIAEQFVPLGRSFQIGQAVNRSKWGAWTYQEYLELAASAAEILRGAGDVTLLGPSVIDFEFHATAAVLNLPDDRVHFDAAAHLLYVDRRGAPENRQLGFDTVDKVVLLHAIAETSRLCASRSWITEVNWPLREGPHSPAGRAVAVDEETQADYLVRYYLLTIGSGLIERVYWWQLIARGYGLVSPENPNRLRRRSAWLALRTMREQLSGHRFLRPLETEGPARLYLFEKDGDELVVGWSSGAPIPSRLPRPAVEIVDRDGRSLGASDGVRIELSSSPYYYRLEAGD